MKAIISGQSVDVQVLKERKMLWWTQVLVEYGVNHRDGGTLLYSNKQVKWINKNKLLN